MQLGGGRSDPLSSSQSFISKKIVKIADISAIRAVVGGGGGGGGVVRQKIFKLFQVISLHNSKTRGFASNGIQEHFADE